MTRSNMISVVVPIYKTEKYLKRCIGSILGQTYRDLEILLIDDGSPDRCGEICDEYAAFDKRVRTFHTVNKGLSAARNLGISKATGDWITFIDSDDWIDKNMIAELYSKIRETGADISECGHYDEYPDKTIEKKCAYSEIEKPLILEAYMEGRIPSFAWGKLFKRGLFDRTTFPEGRVYEDLGTIPKLLDNAGKITATGKAGYHYTQRITSISNAHDIANLIDFWIAYKEQYDYCKNKVSNKNIDTLDMNCAIAVARTWAWFSGCDKKEREKYRDVILEMHRFSKDHFPRCGSASWPLSLRAGVCFTHYNNEVSFLLAYAANRVKRIFLREKTYFK